jgi:hypothetical protein
MMTIGNAWLGGLVLQSTNDSQDLSTNSFVITTPVLSVASTVDWATIRLADATENITISVTPAAGATFSTIIWAAETSGHSAFFWQPDRPMFLAPGDYLTIRVTNDGLSGTVYGNLLTLY